VKPENPLRKKDWFVSEVSLEVCKEMVKRYHYAGGGSNTATFRHGLFRKGQLGCKGVVWWITPTKAAAMANYDGDWRRVLVLSRMVIVPGTPTNAASFLISQSVKLIRASNQWECLLTYADEGQNHTGAIYRATNWEYLGKTTPEKTFVDSEWRMVSRKAGPHTFTVGEMEALGYRCIGKFSRHRFRMILGKVRETTSNENRQLELAI
jgi:hypothetical protein